MLKKRRFFSVPMEDLDIRVTGIPETRRPLGASVASSFVVFILFEKWFDG